MTELNMTPEEASLAAEIYQAMQDASLNSERSEQDKRFQIGISSLGFCSERVRRQLAGQTPEATDMLKAWIGTWLGEGLESALREAWGDEVITQAEVTVELHGDSGIYEIPGHPDIIHPGRGLLLDGKSSNGLALADKTGFTDRQKRFQRHLYGWACFEAGMFGDLLPDEIRVGNVWVDRSGETSELLVRLEPLSEEVREEAAAWLDDVVYAHINDEEARKEPAREMCAKVCGYYRDCRMFDTDVEGLLTDPEVVAAVELYREGQSLESRGRKLKNEAKSGLDGISGSTGEVMVRWIDVPESSVPASVRRAHRKISMTKIKR